MRLALYQPDIPQNTGTILRLCACMAVPIDIIGPTGFDLSDRALRRAAMDYYAHVDLTRHVDWPSFEAELSARGRRLILATTKASEPYTSIDYGANDTVLFGRETSGVPEHVHARADKRVAIPIKPGTRSLNLAVSAAMIVGEAVRQRGRI